MLPTSRGKLSAGMRTIALADIPLASPLKPAELQVLRAQYEKEGDYVGVQTKFNFAWVRTMNARKRNDADGSRVL